MKISKHLFPAIIAVIAFSACNNSEQVQKLKDLATKDSVMLAQSRQKDSSITSYLSDLNDIQNNLDAIKQREKIITVNSPEYKAGTHESIIAEIKDIDGLILSNNRKINALEARLRKMNVKNDTLKSIIAHLTREIAEKDQEIAALQEKLAKSNDSLRVLTARFNDSIVVIKSQRTQNTQLTTKLHTVYYVAGTMKELKDKGVIDKEGGFIGMGASAQLKKGADDNSFTSGDMTDLNSIALSGKFRRLITVHPDNTYKIQASGSADVLVITNPESFWSQSKYLVIAVK